MRHDLIVDGKAMSAFKANNSTCLLPTSLVIAMQQDPQRPPFKSCCVIVCRKAKIQNLETVAVLVNVWTEMAPLAEGEQV